jgi:hypothetical protein
MRARVQIAVYCVLLAGLRTPATHAQVTWLPEQCWGMWAYAQAGDQYDDSDTVNCWPAPLSDQASFRRSASTSYWEICDGCGATIRQRGIDVHGESLLDVSEVTSSSLAVKIRMSGTFAVTANDPLDCAAGPCGDKGCSCLLDTEYARGQTSGWSSISSRFNLAVPTVATIGTDEGASCTSDLMVRVTISGPAELTGSNLNPTSRLLPPGTYAISVEGHADMSGYAECRTSRTDAACGDVRVSFASETTDAQAGFPICAFFEWLPGAMVSVTTQTCASTNCDSDVSDLVGPSLPNCDVFSESQSSRSQTCNGCGAVVRESTVASRYWELLNFYWIDPVGGTAMWLEMEANFFGEAETTDPYSCNNEACWGGWL